MKIKLTDDQIDEVVLYEIKRHSKLLESSIESLKRDKNKLKKFEKEDLTRFKEVYNAMIIVLGYYES